MYNKRLFRTVWVAILQIFVLPSFAQYIHIHGYVVDQSSKERLSGASVLFEDLNLSASTNSYGYFSLRIPQSSDYGLIRARLSGYTSYQDSIPLHRDSLITIGLQEGYTLQAVAIEANKNTGVRHGAGVMELNMNQIKTMPTLLGEVDLVKTLQLLPGVGSGAEGTGGLHIRGGSPDQNLILLDDTPLYYVNHLGGFLSVFNADAIATAQLYKGHFPARYSGRLSGILDVRMREGNLQQWKGVISLGLLSTKFSLEGPLQKEKSSFLFSYRRFNYDWIIRTINLNRPSGANQALYFFDDLNFKINRILSTKDRLYLSAYLGADQYLDEPGAVGGLTEITDERLAINWNNRLFALRWNHLFNPRLFANTSLTYTKFGYSNRADYSVKRKDPFTREVIENNALQLFTSSVEDYSLKWDLSFYPKSGVQIGAGTALTYNIYRPNITQLSEINNGVPLSDTLYNKQQITALQGAAYAEIEWKTHPKWNLKAGLTGAFYRVEDSTFLNLQPRLGLTYIFNDRSSMNVSYTEMRQNIHLLSGGNFGIPIDLWVPSTRKAPVETARQLALNWSYSPNFFFSSITIEGFYKRLTNQIDFREGAGFFKGTGDWQSKIEAQGKGEAYGIEVLLQKNTDRYTGWLSYTWSRSFRTFQQINQREPFPYLYDRPHNLSLVHSYKITPNLTLSANWIFSSGLPSTLPISVYPGLLPGYAPTLDPSPRPSGFSPSYFPGNGWNFPSVLLYTERNTARTIDFHRLDISLQWSKRKKIGERIWNIGVYNAYNRRNTFYTYLGYDRNISDFRLYNYSLFPILPSITYTRKW